MYFLRSELKRRWFFLALVVFALAPFAISQQPGLGNDSDTIINYYDSVGLNDKVSLLQQRLSSGQIKLQFEPQHGYLLSILKELKVPVDSQLLVWSKTSSQADHTSPEHPRALYFNDDVYVGWANGDDLLDLIATDPQKGPIFFTLDQHQSARPILKRESRCLNCHFNNKTLDVPGLLIRSVFAKPDGTPTAQLNSFIAGHNNPLSQRWGGWYVTGTHGDEVHMGNAFLDLQDLENIDLRSTSNVTDLSSRFDTSRYLSPSSDTVALMVLDDAVRMENLITRARFQALHAIHDPVLNNEPNDNRQKIIERAAEPLLMYMLFRDEPPLKGPIRGTTNFARRFAEQGPKDSKGRSLREFDLNTRMFKYHCNYRIYSPEFDAMPEEIKAFIWKRLDEILSGKDQSPTYKGMTDQDRKNILEILLETKPDFKIWMLSHKEGYNPLTS